MQLLILEEASQWPSEYMDPLYALHSKVVEINPCFTMMVVLDPDQLPPVNGSAIYTSEAWAKLRVVMLKENQRQVSENCPLRRLILEGATGEAASPESVAFVVSLVDTTPLPASPGAGDTTMKPVLVVAALNEVADQHNACCLRRLHAGDPTVYEAMDDVADDVSKHLLKFTGLKERVCCVSICHPRTHAVLACNVVDNTASLITCSRNNRVHICMSNFVTTCVQPS